MGNREALLEAAIACLRERGYGGTTARDVAGSARVSLGAIRYHFGSMEGLLDQAVVECGKRWINGLQRSLGESGAASANPSNDLLAEMDRLYELFESEHTLVVGLVEAFAHAQRSESTRQRMATLYDEMRAGVADALATAFGRREAAETAASVLIAIGDGLMVQWLLAPQQRLDPTAVRSMIAELTLLSGR
ncbi:MAG: TetR/AcrR family transcriptional regulator [Pseudonocardia sp.]|nr:TetR/AcrR family transcriptional regulator [Pseudonocardia sp.]